MSVVPPDPLQRLRDALAQRHPVPAGAYGVATFHWLIRADSGQRRGFGIRNGGTDFGQGANIGTGILKVPNLYLTIKEKHLNQSPLR